MAQVQITLNGRTYRLSCEDGEQDRFEEISEYVSAKVEEVIDEFGQIGQERILLMTALMLTDELIDACEEIQDTAEKNCAELNALTHENGGGDAGQGAADGEQERGEGTGVRRADTA